MIISIINRWRWIVLFIFCPILGALYLNSTTWFRLKLADYYMRTQNYDKAVFIYKKALRKENFNLGYNAKVKVNFIELQLRDAYLKSAVYHFNEGNLYLKDLDPETLNLPFFDKTMQEYIKITKLYEDYKKIFTFIPEVIKNKWDKIIKESHETKMESCFAFGEQYVKKGMWQAAKTFYTKTIIKYLNPAVVLERLDTLYNIDERSDIKEKIWGDEIFVTLEDFEDTTMPVLDPWITRVLKLTVNSHIIAKNISHTGRRSEYFDLTYAKHDTQNYDYWVKPLNLPLNNPKLVLGIRVFIKSEKPFGGRLKINITYPKAGGKSPFLEADTKKNLPDGWEEQSMDNLFEKAKTVALENNWNINGMRIENIAIDTHGFSNKFYIDDIELYLGK